MIRVTAWILRFVNNCLARSRHNRRRSGPLVSEEVEAATNRWVGRVQRGVNPDLQAPGWKIIQDKETKILKCKGRLTGYEPVYLEGVLFVDKLIVHTHSQQNKAFRHRQHDGSLEGTLVDTTTLIQS